MPRTILSLCDYSGVWPHRYRQVGYRVVCVDIKHGGDVLTYLDRHDRPENVHGILMAPPCTDFTISGARWWPEKDASGATEQSVRIVQACLAIKDHYKPAWWALENPVGRMPKLVPAVGLPRLYFHPYHYAYLADDPQRELYTKKTGLWGQFNDGDLAELRDHAAEPVMYERGGKRGSWMWANLGGKSERTKTLRSMTPQGFARAFTLAND